MLDKDSTEEQLRDQATRLSTVALEISELKNLKNVKRNKLMVIVSALAEQVIALESLSYDNVLH